MSLTSPIFCYSGGFPFHRVSCFQVFCYCYQLKNKIRLMISLMKIGLNPSPLVCALCLLALKIPLVVLTISLVVFMAWVLLFFFQYESIQLVTFSYWLCSYQYDSSPNVVDSLKYFGTQSSDSPTNF